MSPLSVPRAVAVAGKFNPASGAISTTRKPLMAQPAATRSGSGPGPGSLNLAARRLGFIQDEAPQPGQKPRYLLGRRTGRYLPARIH